MAIRNALTYSVNSVEVFYRIIGILSNIVGVSLHDFNLMSYNERYYDTEDLTLFSSNRSICLSSEMKPSAENTYTTRTVVRAPINNESNDSIEHLRGKEFEYTSIDTSYDEELSIAGKQFIKNKFNDIDVEGLNKRVSLFNKRQSFIMSTQIDHSANSFNIEFDFDELYYNIGNENAINIYRFGMKALNETMENTEEFNTFMESLGNVFKEKLVMYDGNKISPINLTKYQIGIELMKEYASKGDCNDDEPVSSAGSTENQG